MTREFVGQSSWVCAHEQSATWLVYLWDRTHSPVRRDSLTCVTWLIGVHEPCVGFVNASCPADKRVTHLYASRDSLVWGTYCFIWYIHTYMNNISILYIWYTHMECVHTHIYIHIHINYLRKLCMYTYVHIHIYTFICSVCMYVCIG